MSCTVGMPPEWLKSPRQQGVRVLPSALHATFATKLPLLAAQANGEYVTAQVAPRQQFASDRDGDRCRARWAPAWTQGPTGRNS